ncbi:O-antigen ligase family protein [Polaribacter batillariae]|uniref:O-antigen ligase family protein n=1 Tax=Polaribacter batillariae TaxID=2808900 RepID=A0ABX7SW92_9FLAO|nr:O-antigen ligase family protein [Polaribacter batillariae]QTD37575.1 O-antigen ligase family protein [Polaribacter batillariae]
MIKKILNNKLLFIGVHIVFGYLGTLPLFPKIYGFLVVLIPSILIFSSSNEKEEAFLFSSYIVGVEVFTRMLGGFIFYETGKYAIIIFLVLGISQGKFKQVFSVQYVFYILLLLLGIVFTKVPEGESIRKAIVFNLSGPVLLGIAALYFYKRPITREQLLNALFFMLLPLFSMVTFLYFRTPDLSEIVFGGEANFQTSGGFGPNQVATAIGLGIFILTIFILLKEKLSGYLFLDAVFLIYFIFRGLLTFSRGGIITALIAILFLIFFYFLYKKISFKIFFKYISIAVVFLVAVWLYTSNITKGMLDNRYTGKNKAGVQKDITTGRLDILEIQFSNFLDNPLGIGVGNGKYERKKDLDAVTAASHNEAGRLLEEHGVIGLILLLILGIVPLFNFFRGDYFQKAFIISFYLIWFLTINHSAMRIALPGFIYALSLIRITDYEEET